TTFFNPTQNKFYHRQMIIITALWLKVSVSVYITLFKEVELSLFILPFNVLLVLISTPLVRISIFKDYNGEAGRWKIGGHQLIIAASMIRICMRGSIRWWTSGRKTLRQISRCLSVSVQMKGSAAIRDGLVQQKAPLR